MFHEGSGVAMNTVPPSDYSYFEMLNDVVQSEPATSLDPELMGSLAAIGIVKGKPFAPDARMKKILDEAAKVGNAAARSLFMHPRDPSWFYYPGSSWSNYLFVTGYQFETPIPMITPQGAKPFPPTGYRTLDARTNFFYGITGITPAMAMRLTGIGSQYLLAMFDADKHYFDGAKTYKVTLPKGIPEANFWSLTAYDNQTRSMLDTPQRYPRAGSQSYPSPAAVGAVLRQELAAERDRRGPLSSKGSDTYPTPHFTTRIRPSCDADAMRRPCPSKNSAWFMPRERFAEVVRFTISSQASISNERWNHSA